MANTLNDLLTDAREMDPDPSTIVHWSEIEWWVHRATINVHSLVSGTDRMWSRWQPKAVKQTSHIRKKGVSAYEVVGSALPLSSDPNSPDGDRRDQKAVKRLWDEIGFDAAEKQIEDQMRQWADKHRFKYTVEITWDNPKRQGHVSIKVSPGGSGSLSFGPATDQKALVTEIRNKVMIMGGSSKQRLKRAGIDSALHQFVQANEPALVRKLRGKAREVYDAQVEKALPGADSPKEFAKWMGRNISDFWQMAQGNEPDVRQQYYSGLSDDDLMDVSDALEAAEMHYGRLDREFQSGAGMRSASSEMGSDSSLRAASLRIASELPKGDPTRRELLAALRDAGRYNRDPDEHRDYLQDMAYEEAEWERAKATFIPVAGRPSNKWPSDESGFSLREVQKIVGGDVARFKLSDGRVMLVDVDAAMKGQPPNREASKLARQPIAGPVLVVNKGRGW